MPGNNNVAPAAPAETSEPTRKNKEAIKQETQNKLQALKAEITADKTIDANDSDKINRVLEEEKSKTEDLMNVLLIDCLKAVFTPAEMITMLALVDDKHKELLRRSLAAMPKESNNKISTVIREKVTGFVAQIQESSPAVSDWMKKLEMTPESIVTKILGALSTILISLKIIPGAREAGRQFAMENLQSRIRTGEVEATDEQRKDFKVDDLHGNIGYTPQMERWLKYWEKWVQEGKKGPEPSLEAGYEPKQVAKAEEAGKTEPKKEKPDDEKSKAAEKTAS